MHSTTVHGSPTELSSSKENSIDQVEQMWLLAAEPSTTKFVVDAITA